MLMLEGDKLDFYATQFAYERKSITWTVTAVVDHFNQGGMPVFRAIDMSKTFNMVEWSGVTNLLSTMCQLIFSLSS